MGENGDGKLNIDENDEHDMSMIYENEMGGLFIGTVCRWDGFGFQWEFMGMGFLSCGFFRGAKSGIDSRNEDLQRQK